MTEKPPFATLTSAVLCSLSASTQFPLFLFFSPPFSLPARSPPPFLHPPHHCNSLDSSPLCSLTPRYIISDAKKHSFSFFSLLVSVTAVWTNGLSYPQPPNWCHAVSGDREISQRTSLRSVSVLEKREFCNRRWEENNALSGDMIWTRFIVNLSM